MSDAAVLGLRGGRYFAMILFCYGAKDRDWLASIWRDEGGDGEWHFDYRFRYYATREKGDAFSDQDEKSFYSVNLRVGMTEEKACVLARSMAEAMVVAGFNDTLDVIEPKSADPDKVGALLRERPWFHFKSAAGASA